MSMETAASAGLKLQVGCLDYPKQAVRIALSFGLHGPAQEHIAESREVGLNGLSTGHWVCSDNAQRIKLSRTSLRSASSIEGVRYSSKCECPV